jgi:alkylation response protein AidB-like acyl-CoA dehydrogenase
MSQAQNRYKADLREVEFLLFEQFKMGDILSKAPYANWGVDEVKMVLEATYEFATSVLGPLNAVGDREKCKLVDGKVITPTGFKNAWKKLFEAGWRTLSGPEEFGGQGAPRTLQAVAEEFFSGANVAFMMYPGLALGAAEVIEHFGLPEQRKLYCSRMFNGKWGGTMCLTEPHAGSDVGSATTTAKRNADGSYSIKGTKIYISGGDHDCAENVIHLVLARIEGAEAGTKGLSLFIVPKFLVGDGGALGERNGIFCTSVEHKMGIKASATCVMEMGADKPAVGYLVGEVHDGIAQMFKVIEQARMFIGVKSMSTLSTAYLNALSYAKDRVQGGDLLKIMDKTSPRVRIIQHPDVRRMLMMQKVFAEGLRALCMYGAHMQDQIELKGGHGSADGETKQLDKLNDFLLPLIKGYSSERAYDLLNASLQTFGGAGFTQDWPIEQYIRDQKIDTLYEGTTHIQALDLIFRKIARDNGETFMGLLGEVTSLCESGAGGDELKGERESLAKAVGQLQGIMGVMLPRMGESLYHVGLHANRILNSVAEVVIGWLLLKAAVIAQKKLPEASEADKAFYDGKIASLRFYTKEILPNIALHKKVIEGGDLSLMEVSEAAF